MVTRRVPGPLRVESKLCISVTRADGERLRDLAAARNLTLSYVVREIIRDYLARADANAE